MTLQQYLQGLAKVVAELVGDKLSIAKGSNPIPSVFIARQKPPKPFYPYSAVDYIGKGNYGGKELYSSFSDDGNSYDSYFNRRVRLRISLYGKYGDNILDTIDELASRLRGVSGRDSMDKYMPNAGLVEVSEPSFNDTLLTTEYEEFTFITLDFWVISKITDNNFYDISTIETGGSLYTDYEQQEEPLTLINTVTRNN